LLPLSEYNLYRRGPVAHFSKQTLRSKYIHSKNGLQLSSTLAKSLNLEVGSKVSVNIEGIGELQTEVILDEGMEGAFMAFDDYEGFMGNSRYFRASITKEL
ncbi:MAG: NADH-quinone oxidoreductase subunit G, partial [Helicobacter sp.]|nr:NADH-quinone oxidoreductase subunit G [Helicobacter sp.]